MAIFRSARRPRGSGGSGRFGLAELAIVLAGLAIATGLLIFTSRSVATFERNIPLASVLDGISLDMWQARDGVFEQLGGDTKIDVEADVFAKLRRASASCRGLVVGTQTPEGFVPPLPNEADRDIATSICRDVDNYTTLTQALLDNPKANGEGTDFDIRLDALFDQVLKKSDDLSRSLDLSIAGDVDRLRTLGRVMALASITAAVLVALIAGRHRRQLVQQRQELADLGTIVKSTADAVFAMDLGGTITSWNPGAEALYGYEASEIIGSNASILGTSDRRDAYITGWQSIIAGAQAASYETLGVRKDGRQLPVAVTLSPIMDGARFRGISAIARDMTERVAKDVELATARNEALEASRLKSQFLATMSHEIRTPLNGVIGLNALLLETSLTDVQRQYAEGVESAGEALLALINDVLDFSKLEASKFDLESVSFDPRVLLEKVAALLAVPAHTKGLELLAYCSPDVPVSLVGDAGRIRQILLNLGGNAVKFTSRGEVSIRAEMVDSDFGDRWVRFEVRDTGIGLADEGQERLFEPFSQADASTTRRFGGTGLGLAISQRLVSAMGGQLGVSSMLGEGSVFWFSAPLPAAPAANPAPLPVPHHELLHGLRVLVVDDNATSRSILVLQLTAWRMLPEAVEDAPTALSQLRAAAAAGQPYDIAVLDLLTPDLDGLELARLMAADPTLKHIRKILLTSSAPVDRGELTAAGIAEWCAKPVRASVLYDQLLRLMAVDKPTEPVPSPPADTASVVPSRRGRILVAEDNAINQLVAGEVLRKLGYDADIVSNGAEALVAIDTGSYSAVLMDCHMPIMDGFEATRQIRMAEAAAGRRLPIIAMTAGVMEEDRERCTAAGMDDYIAKPVSIKAIDDALVHWIRSATGDEPRAPENAEVTAAYPTMGGVHP